MYCSMTFRLKLCCMLRRKCKTLWLTQYENWWQTDDENVRARTRRTLIELIDVVSDTTDIAIDVPKNRQFAKLFYSAYYGGYKVKLCIMHTADSFMSAADLYPGNNLNFAFWLILFKSICLREAGISDNLMMQQCGIFVEFDDMVVLTG